MEILRKFEKDAKAPPKKSTKGPAEIAKEKADKMDALLEEKKEEFF